MADVRRLTELGVVPALAKELDAQITAKTGNRRRLEELGMPPLLAKEFVANITSKPLPNRRLGELGMPINVIVALNKLVAEANP